MNVNKYWFWWVPGFMTFPLLIVSPSLGRATIIATIVILIFLKVWTKRTRTRVLYINSLIDKGVVFGEATIRDQLQRRRKTIVMNHENVKAYTRTTQMLTLTMTAMIIFIYIYANVYWVRNLKMYNLAIYKPMFEHAVKEGAIYTSVGGGILMVMCSLFAFLQCRYFAKNLREPNKADVDEAEHKLTPEEREALIKAANESAASSGGMIANIARRQVSDEAEEKAAKAKAAGGKMGSIASKARLDVSDKPWQTLDEKIEFEHREALKKEASAEQEASDNQES